MNIKTEIIEQILSKKKKLQSAAYLNNFKILLIYSDSDYRILDMNFIHHKDMGDFLSIRNENEFRKFRINKRFNTIQWTNGYDISPESLYMMSKPAEINEVKKAS